MSRSERWQKFFKIYCIFTCIMVGLVYLLTILGDSVLAMQYAWPYNTAWSISFALFAVTMIGADALLWLISLGVWFSRRQSAKLWHILLWGLVLLAAKFFNFAAYFTLSGGSV
ncbi:MAG: hypothetical protein IKK72_03670 [Oscillospiraceae bacterium]|nr:hypothetical protein [Oscillospiraceae bacterium]